MRKLLLPSALVLLLGLGYAGAQTINRAIQLSQDTTGAFSVDTNNNVFFPGHIISSTSINFRPAPTIAGTATATLSGTDTAGTITMGTSAATATVTFGTAYLTVPSCVVTQLSTTTGTATVATTSIAIVQTTATGNKVNYVCIGATP